MAKQFTYIFNRHTALKSHSGRSMPQDMRCNVFLNLIGRALCDFSNGFLNRFPLQTPVGFPLRYDQVLAVILSGFQIGQNAYLCLALI